MYHQGHLVLTDPQDPLHQVPSRVLVHGTMPAIHPTKIQACTHAVALFDHDLRADTLHTPYGTPLTIDRAAPHLTGRPIACWCPKWDETTPCPACLCPYLNDPDLAEVCELRRSCQVMTIDACPACEGTGYARYPCHGDVWLRVTNPTIVFPWSTPTL